jgi:Skp family chaperone for outer membrane proteins
MKKNLIIALLLLSISSVSAQHEKIKALKIAHITSELNLSSSEAQKFWPIYNASEKNTHLLRRKLRDIHQKLDQTFETISEKKATEILNTMLEIEHEMYQEKTSLIQNLKSFLSAKKIIQLEKSEDEFKRKLLEEFKDRRPPLNGDRNNRR